MKERLQNEHGYFENKKPVPAQGKAPVSIPHQGIYFSNTTASGFAPRAVTISVILFIIGSGPQM